MKKYIKILFSIVTLCIVFSLSTTTVRAYYNDNTEQLANAGMPLYTFDSVEEWKEWYFDNRTYKFWWLSFVWVRHSNIGGVDYYAYPFNDYDTWREWWDWCWERYDNGYLKFEFATEEMWGRHYYDDAPLEEIERINRERLKAENVENLEQLLLAQQKQKAREQETVVSIEEITQEQLASADYSMKEEKNIFKSVLDFFKR